MNYGDPYRIDEPNIFCYRMMDATFVNSPYVFEWVKYHYISSIVSLGFTIYTN